MARTPRTGSKPSRRQTETESVLSESTPGSASSAEATARTEAETESIEDIAPLSVEPPALHADETERLAAEGQPAFGAGPSDPETSETSPSPQAAPPAQGSVTRVERRGGFLPLVAGGLVAGAIGFGAATYVVPRYFPTLGTPNADAALQDELKAQSGRLAALDKSVSELRAQQDSPATASVVPEALTAEVANLGSRLDTLDQNATGLDDKIAALDARLTEVEKRPLSGDAASASASDAFQREMEGFRAEIAAQKQAIEAAKGEIADAAKAAAATIESVSAKADQMRREAEIAAKNATISGSLDRLKAALDSGAALDAPIADLKAAGLDVPAALSDQAQGVPTLAALRESFPESARKALAVSVQETAGTDVWSRVTAFFRSQSGARSLTPRAGDDPDAVLSRAEAALRAGDLAAALAELKSLPEAGQAAMAEWAARAERRLQAVAAVAALQQQVE